MLVVGGFVGIKYLASRPNAEEKRLLAAAPAAATAAGCDAVREVPAYPGDLDQEHVGGENVRTLPPLDDYPSRPPTSGPHAHQTLSEGNYSTPPSIGRAIHSLEHGAVIVWFSPELATDPEIRRIEAFFARGDERDHVIVAPYDYPGAGEAGALPRGFRVAFTAWHRVRYCERPSLEVAYSFVDAFRYSIWRVSSYRGEAPEGMAAI